MTFLSPNDPRDFTYRAAGAFDPIRLEMVPLKAPSNIPLFFSWHGHPALRQEQQEGPLCVPFSVLQLKQLQDCFDSGGHRINYSERNLYRQCKALDGIPDQPGTYPRVALEIMRTTGCRQETLPEDQLSSRIAGYARITTLDHLKAACLQHGPPPAVFKIDRVWKNMPKRINHNQDPAEPLSLHCVNIIGWKPGWLEVDTHWGRKITLVSEDHWLKYCKEIWTAWDLTGLAPDTLWTKIKRWFL